MLGEKLSRLNGLSPRVRGKLLLDGAGHLGQRSIPACAGEAVIVGASLCGRWVYPRVCGGSNITTAAAATAAGLSPRVRGKRRR